MFKALIHESTMRTNAGRFLTYSYLSDIAAVVACIFLCLKSLQINYPNREKST